MERKAGLFSGTALMMLMSFVKPAIGIVLLPLYLTVLSSDEYGLYLILVAVSAIVNIVGTLRINNAMTTFFFDYNHDTELTLKYLRQIFSFSLFMAIACFFFFILFGEWIFELIFSDESITFHPYGLIVVATGVLNACNSVYFIFLKNNKYFFKLSYILLFQILLAVIIQVVLILIFKLGVYGLLLGIMVPSLFTTIYVASRHGGLIEFSLQSKFIVPSLKYSIALIPFLLIYWLTTTGDKIILEKYIDLNAIGQYGLLMTVSGVLFLVGDAVMNGIRPFLYEEFQKGNTQTDFVIKLVKYFMAANLLMSGVILLIGSNIHLITSQINFLHAIPLFVFSTVLVFLRNYLLLFNLQLNYVKSSRTISFYSVVSLVILLTAYHFFVPQYQLNGVFYAGIFAGTLTAFIFYIAAQQKLKIGYLTRDIWLIPIAMFFVCFLIYHYLNIPIPVKGLLYFIISIIAFISVMGRNIFEFLAFIKHKISSIGKA